MIHSTLIKNWVEKIEIKQKKTRNRNQKQFLRLVFAVMFLSIHQVEMGRTCWPVESFIYPIFNSAAVH